MLQNGVHLSDGHETLKCERARIILSWQPCKLHGQRQSEAFFLSSSCCECHLSQNFEGKSTPWPEALKCLGVCNPEVILL